MQGTLVFLGVLAGQGTIDMDLDQTQEASKTYTDCQATRHGNNGRLIEMPPDLAHGPLITGGYGYAYDCDLVFFQSHRRLPTTFCRIGESRTKPWKQRQLSRM